MGTIAPKGLPSLLYGVVGISETFGSKFGSDIVNDVDLYSGQENTTLSFIYNIIYTIKG